MRTSRKASTGALALLLALTLGALAVPSAIGRSQGPAARSASSYLTGIGDEHATMFRSPLWKQLHTRIVRYIAPYDAVTRTSTLNAAITFIQAAEVQHVQVLVSFYHSEHTPTKLPSVASYQRDVQRFVRLFPHVKQYQSWDESNRGNIRGVLASPSAAAAARYYQALIRVCHGCSVIGLDVLDAANISPTLSYISEFKHEVGRLRTVMPKIWGLHNYSDINRLESWRTRELVRALGGQVWLTETGGLVQFGGAYPNRNGSGLSRAAKVLKFMFAVAGSQPQVKRLYIYDWTGGTARTRFDAGLTSAHGQPRAGYIVVCRQLHAAKCNARVSRN
ncbi:MAG TPA: hypothetical protein VII01_09235 [Solirubrobacteraceae bacterium]|jgi:hypothetical protein